MTNGTDNIFASGKYNATYNPSTGEVFSLESDDGLTKREFFAAMAMQGLLVTYAALREGDNSVAVDAVRMADKLIDALNV